MADNGKYIEIKAERLILVEGWDDVRFMEKLITELGIDGNLFQIINYTGVENLRNDLNTIKLSSNNFDTVTHISVIRDMDYEGEPFVGIADALRANNISVPQKPGEIVAGDLSVGVFLFPDNVTKGMLEDLCLQAFEGDIILGCIDEYLACLSNNNMKFVDSALPKAKINTLIATKSLDKSIRKKDRKVWSLDYAVSKRWWDWEHPAFNDIKAFVQQLAR